MGRYRGSSLGLAWSLIHPLFMLAVYTFVFAVVFEARWGVARTESRSEFAITLFSGLIIYNLFAECINRAPLLLVQNVNYVKKVVFPLEILPIVSMCSAIFHSGVSLLVLAVAQVIILHTIPWTAILFPLVILPLLIGTIGASWFLASLGVFLRDLTHITGLVTTMMLFMSPVFYPISALPVELRPWLNLNPLTFVLEAGRGVLIFGQLPNPLMYLAYLSASLIIALFGFWWFQRTRRGFSDVL